MSVLNLDALRDALADPTCRAVIERGRQRGGWTLIQWVRQKLAEARERDDTDPGYVDRLIAYRDEKLDRWGEPPAGWTGEGA